MTLQEVALRCLERPPTRLVVRASLWKVWVQADFVESDGFVRVAWAWLDYDTPDAAERERVRVLAKLQDPLACLALATGAP